MSKNDANFAPPAAAPAYTKQNSFAEQLWLDAKLRARSPLGLPYLRKNCNRRHLVVENENGSG
jgi:hypothetical protein